MREAITVFLLSGNRLLREALERVLRKRRDMEVAAALPWGPAINEDLLRARADVLLADLSANEATSIEQLSQLRSELPDIQTILLGMPDDEQLFLESVRAGVRGYVLDEASALEVVEAVRNVAAGRAVCPTHFTAVLFDYIAQQSEAMPSLYVRMQLGLTRREQQLVPMIAGGLTNKEIAAELNLSEQTVKNHIHRMLRKAGVNDRLSIVELCRLQGLRC